MADLLLISSYPNPHPLLLFKTEPQNIKCSAMRTRLRVSLGEIVITSSEAISCFTVHSWSWDTSAVITTIKGRCYERKSA